MTYPIPIASALKLSGDAYECVTLRVDGCEAYCTTFGDTQVVAFRGTEAGNLITGGGWKDVLRDMRAFPWWSARVGWSHSGFLKGARGVVDCGLFGILRRDIPVVLVGHSLGGALSINAAAMLHTMGFNVVGVMTFGSPRTFTKGTADKWRQRLPIWEFSNAGDPIPDVPFKFFGYRHVNEIPTSRKADGYSILKNHMIDFYYEAFGIRRRKK